MQNLDGCATGTSGYLTIIPALLIMASVWVQVRLLKHLMHIYFFTVLCGIAVITAVDVILYSHWGFHLDPVVLFYLRNPYEAMISGTLREWLTGTLIALVFAAALYYACLIAVRKPFARLGGLERRGWKSLVLALLILALFLPVRGGVTVSTMNASRAYFSDRMFLNHAAINPAFNFLYALNRQDDFESTGRFFEKSEAMRIFNRLMEPSEPSTHDETRPAERLSLLHTELPIIILFVLESFSYGVALDSVVAPNMYGYAREGVLFENFYASSFRTDRGLPAILSGYPAHPEAAILKYPKKTDNLPALPRLLRANGYENQSLYYGGDINFANMQSYFVGACGIRHVVSDRDFPVKSRLTKWGAPDRYVIDRAYSDLMEAKPGGEPFLKIVLTLSSHEPFDVPVRRFDVPFLNAVHYVDACIGRFVSDLKSTPLWDNTLLVFISDHAMQGYPAGADNTDRIRFHIPMIWTGGAVAHAPAVIPDYGSQIDLAATLLSQLGIDHSGFRFSRDMLHPAGRKFAYYTYMNGFGMLDAANFYLYDNNRQETLAQAGDAAIEKEAKAFFQMMCTDLDDR